jgi:hypothetical protein
MENTTEVVDQVEVEVAEVEDSGNLPSAKEETKTSLDKFAISQELQEKHFKDGKLYGRFDSMEAVLNTLKDVETKYSNVMREIKSPAQTEDVPQVVSVQEAAAPIMEKFKANDFDYTGMDEEIAEVAEKSGKSVAEIKLMAIEMKENVTKAYAQVGGKEEYVAMQQWAIENLNEADKIAFGRDLDSGMSKFAIKGLYQEYRNATDDGSTRQRIQGSSANSGSVRGYNSFNEMARDRAYVHGKGKNDANAVAAHNKRMSLTADNIVFGR